MAIELTRYSPEVITEVCSELLKLKVHGNKTEKSAVSRLEKTLGMSVESLTDNVNEELSEKYAIAYLEGFEQAKQKIQDKNKKTILTINAATIVSMAIALASHNVTAIQIIGGQMLSVQLVAALISVKSDKYKEASL